jgi:crotonobetaine/carnitine-CoA ligase
MRSMATYDSLLETLRASVAAAPDREFLRIAGTSYSRAEVLSSVETTARGLREFGINPGDRVGIMCDNRPETIWIWLGTNGAQAVDVPFNAEARGKLLDYFVADAKPRFLVGNEQYLTILAESITSDPELVVMIGEHTTKPFGGRAKQITFDEVIAAGAASAIELPVPPPGTTATIMYTSGTTGPSKGVMLPQRYYPAQAAHAAEMIRGTEDDIVMCVQPLFHIDARAFLVSSLHLGCVAVVGRRFSVSTFWDEVREHKATVFGTIGTMLWMLYKQPPQPNDRDHSARIASCSSTPGEILRAFEERFGLGIVELYGMTECVLITGETVENTQPGRIGRPIPQVEVRIVDDNDAPVEKGEIGELIYRPREHFAMMRGYWNKPEATADAWQNLWFHTGDLVRQYPDDMIEYIGRKKDSIRRRGENVSAWEVEQACANHPSVLDVAAIGVPSEVGEEDVAVVVVQVPGATLDPVDLVEFVTKDLPRFAVPRYVEIVDSLPKGPSERVEKGKVRERGITSAAWDANLALGRR